MTPLEIVQDIIKISLVIYEQVEKVENNKKKWRGLRDLIKTVLRSLEDLPSLPAKKSFIDALKTLQVQIHDAASFLDTIINMSYVERFAKAGRHQSKIEGYRHDILELIPVLNLGLNAQQLLDREQDRQNGLADRAALMQAQEARLYQRQAEHLKQQRDLEAVIAKQMQSFRKQMERDFQASPPKPAEPLLPDQFMVKPYEITFKEKLSESRLGDIYQGEWHGQAVAIKWIEGTVTAVDRRQFIRDAQIMSHLRHDHIIPFFGACFDEGQMCIVTGSIDQPLSDCLSLLEQVDRLRIAHELASGLAYLHQRDVIHSDIELKNIGITTHGQAKWLDLSWVKSNLSSLASVGIAHDVSLWQAPETWGRRNTVTKASDVYSFGWLLWSLVTGQLPFPNSASDSFHQQIKAGLRESLPRDCPPHLSDLITRCWHKHPSRRPAITEITELLNQPFVPARSASPSGETYYLQGKAAHKEGDLTTAFACYTRSSEKHYAKSYNSLGFFSLQGEAGQRKDPEKAKDYFEQGARKGNATAMGNLARLYEKGVTREGVSLTSALAWYERAHQADPEEPRYQSKVNTLTQTIGQSSAKK